MEPLAVLGRLLPSLAVIVGALLVVRWWAQRGRGGLEGALRVLARAGVTKGAVVAVVEVDQRRFLVGAGDHGVTLLGELEAPDPLQPDYAVAQPEARPASAGGPIGRLQRMTVRSPAPGSRP